MARVGENVLPAGTQMGLSLDRYAEVMLLDTDAFNGLNRPPSPDSACRSIWTQTQRDHLAQFIVAAETMRERELHYYLAPKITWQEEHPIPPNGNPFILTWKHLISVGVPRWSLIEDNITIDYSSDPAQVVIVTDVEAGEIRVTYPGEAVEINPTSIRSSGASQVTISIPWARLIRPELNDDRDDHLNYYDMSNYLPTVDVWRYEIDETAGVTYVFRGAGCDNSPCAISCAPACARIAGERARRISQISVYPTTTGCHTCDHRSASLIRVTYLSGKTDILNEIYTARLAHTLMPYSPCGNDQLTQHWKDDHAFVPGVNTRYGNRNASIEVWLADSGSKVGAGGRF